ncbi:hypothetical protein AB1286_25555 [Trinickia sp. NRRL B-1857]|uniref:hypothetical protein n=1 Tax=Trinickia sp. NRRL B-1857 TaxID=3162879 RepID=UPI003D288343
MSITSGLMALLRARNTAARAISNDEDAYGYVLPLQWRKPWYAWQFASWALVTLTAPPFCFVAALLVVDPRSDQPLFWPGALIAVALANAMAIVLSNQRHYRDAFVTRAGAARYYFGIGAASAAGLFLLLVWATGSIATLIDPLASAQALLRPELLALWAVGLAAGFGISSSAHASILHAWLAFEP